MNQSNNKTKEVNTGTSTWNPEASSGIWNDPSNWLTNTVPTINAIFGDSAITKIGFTSASKAVIQSIIFNEDAPPYELNFITEDTIPILTIAGAGVINNGTTIQCFSIKATAKNPEYPQLRFTNNASAGNSNMKYYAGPTSLADGSGGGIICFVDNANAGSASFTVRTGAQQPPAQGSTVGAEVVFMASASASNAIFVIYGTLGDDGDTFGNVVFKDLATADKGLFVNKGGTVSGGDGGNTQFYDNSNAAHGQYNNYGGTVSKANGGDVAFDGTATGGYGLFINKAAIAEGAYGGVTSFNNNPPEVVDAGATAGNAIIHNFGATPGYLGGGGHTEFTAKHGNPTAGNATFYNYGSCLDEKSSAGHTLFSINQPTSYFPTAGNGTFHNYGGTAEKGSGGYTQFSEYSDSDTITPATNVPNGGNGIFYNHGAEVAGAYGGYTSFGENTDAGNSTLIAYAGINGGGGGIIAFYGSTIANKAKIELYGNGKLELGQHTGALSVFSLKANFGVISTALGSTSSELIVLNKMSLNGSPLLFSFYTENTGFNYNQKYTILSAPNLSDYSVDSFSTYPIGGISPNFEISGTNLTVAFYKHVD